MLFKNSNILFNNNMFKNLDFPGGTVFGSLPASAGDVGSSPRPGGSHMLRSH